MKLTPLLFLVSTFLFAQKPEIGIVQDMEKDSLLYAAGYRYLLESVSRCFSPRTLTDEQFQVKLQSIKKLKMKLVAANIFIPGELKLVGPDVNESAILAYVEIVFQRCRQADVKLIVWGSGGARRIPEGFDPSMARNQFISIAGKIAKVARKYDIIIALENLNSGECNFINTLQSAYDIIKAVHQPNLRLNADIYHMMKENESPAIIETAGKYIVHCEIAEKDKRTPPGTMGDDFQPYLQALKKIHYKGKIMLECRWGDLASEAAPARVMLEHIIDDVYE